MKLAISNIAWDADENDEVLALLGSTPVTGIEVAPTKIWPGWRGVSPESAGTYAGSLTARGFAVPAMQSILFERPDLRVFGDEETQEKLLDHLEMVASVGQALGAAVLVFGSPRNRDPGALPKPVAETRGVEFFRKAGERCTRHKIRLCVEPNPKVHQCAFLTSWREAADFVAKVDHPGVGLHLDTACISLEGDDVVEAIRACAHRIAHFHISEPNLADFASAQLDHQAFGATLRDVGYAGWRSIEMRRSAHPLESVARAAALASVWYAS